MPSAAVEINSAERSRLRRIGPFHRPPVQEDKARKEPGSVCAREPLDERRVMLKGQEREPRKLLRESIDKASKILVELSLAKPWMNDEHEQEREMPRVLASESQWIFSVLLRKRDGIIFVDRHHHRPPVLDADHQSTPVYPPGISQVGDKRRESRVVQQILKIVDRYIPRALD